MSRWTSLESVPRDGTKVLFWEPDDEFSAFKSGEVRMGSYVAPLDCYLDEDGREILPICWRHLPNGPTSAAELWYEREIN